MGAGQDPVTGGNSALGFQVQVKGLGGELWAGQNKRFGIFAVLFCFTVSFYVLQGGPI